MNSELNVFNPVDLDLSRSTFDMHPTRTGTCVAGRLLPVFSFEVYPGDSIKMDVRSLFKMTTPLYPTMDQLYADVYFYFVPNRLVLGSRYGNPTAAETACSWAAFIGAQDNLSNCPLPTGGNRLPYIETYGNPKAGSLLDYFVGCSNTGYVSSPKLNSLPLLTYFAIWNEDFRDPNTTKPVTWYVNTSNHKVSPTGVVETYICKPEAGYGNRGSWAGGSAFYELVNALATDQNPASLASADAQYWLPFPVYRFHGYFGSALPWPQRNTDGVELPLGSSAPVYTQALDNTLPASAMPMLHFADQSGDDSNVYGNLGIRDSSAGLVAQNDQSITGGTYLIPMNLYADLSHATAANVNALRAAIQKQRWYEKLARSGNRFDEFEYGTFGVRPADSGADRPVLLGSKRIPLGIEMVASTNGASGGSLGNLGGFSHTNDKDHMFYHSFAEWGTLQCVICIRHHDTFASGLEKMWTRETRDDYFFPTMAHLGEMSIANRELGNDVTDKSVFGYQEAWEDLRQCPDRVTGLTSPGEAFGYMTYASSFVSPTLNSFLNASYQIESIDRTLLAPASAAGFQFVYQMTFDMSVRRCMPTYSIPGLMDHF